MNFRLPLQRHGREDGVVATNGRPDFIVLFARVDDVLELRRRGKHRASKPDSKALHVMRDDVNIDGRRLDPPIGELLAPSDALVDASLDVALQPPAKVLEHGRAAGEHDVLIEAAARVDRRRLDGGVNHSRHWRRVVGVADLWIEEDLWSQEALVRDVALPALPEPRLARRLLHPLARVLVVLLKLLGHVRANVAVLLLDAARNVHGVVGRDGALALAHEQLDEVGDVAAGDRDVLDARADHVAIRHGDDVRDAVASVDHRARQRPLSHLLGRPRGAEREDGLHGDVQPLHVERLEHDLGGELAVLRRVHGRLRKEEVVLLRVAAHVAEDAALPVALHRVPVLDDAVPDGVVHSVFI
mmetsp:Transcript_6067/g.13267  ORF Transcript_6067/g.13267 Transcript_6067/m.13267 type:complete len:357 (-) Transcript_6067:244-1314(-)